MFKTDGTWDRADRPLMFMPGHAPRTSGTYRDMSFHLDFHPSQLIAINDLMEKSITYAELDMSLTKPGAHVLIDSGIFWLANSHAIAHDMSMDQALALHPSEIDGFEGLWDTYLAVHAKYGEKVWGMIELDQGGADRKRETRAKLADLGITPIPVYHPLNDGWDYFDELASNYDRICLGNIVQAPRDVRRRLIATVWERKQADYPDLWVHVLGFHADQLFNAYPLESSDASSWMISLRYGSQIVRVDNASFGSTVDEFIYDQATAAESGMYEKAVEAAAWSLAAQIRLTRHRQGRLVEEIGAVI